MNSPEQSFATMMEEKSSSGVVLIQITNQHYPLYTKQKDFMEYQHVKMFKYLRKRFWKLLFLSKEPKVLYHYLETQNIQDCFNNLIPMYNYNSIKLT